MAQSPAPPQPDSALTVADPGRALEVLNEFPPDRFNRLVPTTVVQQANPYLRPVVAIVELDVERDTYTSNDLQKGERALGKTGLGKLRNVAGISVVEQYRSDDGSDPDAVEYTTRIAMPTPSGQLVTAVGIKRMDLNKMRFASPAHRERTRHHLSEHAATRSELRAVRALLTLHGAYPEAELRKPWAVVHYVPNMDEPEVRAAMLAAIAPTSAGLFGRDARAVEPGPDLKQIEAPQAPDDEPSTETGREHAAAGRLDTKTGEIVQGDAGWFAGDPGPIPLADRLASRARLHSNAGMTGAPSDEQKAALQTALGALGKEDASIVILRVFSHEKLSQTTTAEAAAILETIAEPGAVDEWKQLAGRLRSGQ